MVARLIGWLRVARRGRAPTALLALVAGFALAIGGEPGEIIAHAAEVQAAEAEAAAQADAAGPDAVADDPATPDGKSPVTLHRLCAGHCAAHLASLLVLEEGDVVGRVEAADWTPAPGAPAYGATPDGLERPPRV
ncbi:MAG: hypothetical protein AB1942_00200 [Pseudomonadota bacterium]